MSIAIVFCSPPYGSTKAREGLDALLSLAAFSDEIECFFLSDGIINLFSEQKAGLILQRQHSDTFKLLDLYEIDKRYVANEDMASLMVKPEELLIDVISIPKQMLLSKLAQAEKILTF